MKPDNIAALFQVSGVLLAGNTKTFNILQVFFVEFSSCYLKMEMTGEQKTNETEEIQSYAPKSNAHSCV